MVVVVVVMVVVVVVGSGVTIFQVGIADVIEVLQIFSKSHCTYICTYSPLPSLSLSLLHPQWHCV